MKLHDDNDSDEEHNQYDEAMDQVAKMMEAVARNDKVINAVGMVYRRMFDSLTSNGFTPDQAVQIIVHQGHGIET